jgi:hypothetical protein
VKAELEPLCRRKTTADGKEQWYFSKSIRIPGVSHTVRIVGLWKQQQDAEPAKILVTPHLTRGSLDGHPAGTRRLPDRSIS